MSIAAIEKVLIIDDDPQSRGSYVLAIEDAELEAVQVEGPLGSLADFVAATQMSATGALCDFELGAKNFATFNGAELVSEWYRSGSPAVLCTRFEKAQLVSIRPYRRWIPRLLLPSELNPDSLVESLDAVQKEIDGIFEQSRIPHRTLIRVLEIDPDDARLFLFEIPAWSDEALSCRISDLPTSLRSQVKAGYRTHVRANIGAEKSEDIYFTGWGE